MRADGKNLIGHAGVVLLRKAADRVGLATALSVVLPKGTGPGWRDQGVALVPPTCAIVLGTTNVLLYDEPELAAADPETTRMKLCQLPARLASHTRRTLHLDRTWPWAAAFTSVWQQAHQLPALA
ncbi:hypothetical protein ACFV3F_28730 [Streptomyces sp. NPDC059717]|uniref:hypothetical protein n=1 Tax=Streptomyces sp. NPDC059717 TaxID=3346922 RepID=UPI0036B84862